VPDLPRHTLVLGGARSGKSVEAERRLAAFPGVVYVATGGSREGDPEWAARIAEHRVRRPASWRTVETCDLAPLLAEDGPPLLIDCLSLWLTHTMDEVGAWDDLVDDTGEGAGAEGGTGGGAEGGTGAVGAGAGAGGGTEGGTGAVGAGAGAGSSTGAGTEGGTEGGGGRPAGAAGWERALAVRVAELVASVRATRRTVVAVSNEVGSGVVPATASGRRFRDELGRLNTAFAAECEQVLLTVAGQVLPLRG
jgi:adenosylcobinamide kinase / adenosylcobinamide-phosphate guanylyltransferase